MEINVNLCHWLLNVCLSVGGSAALWGEHCFAYSLRITQKTGVKPALAFQQNATGHSEIHSVINLHLAHSAVSGLGLETSGHIFIMAFWLHMGFLLAILSSVRCRVEKVLSPECKEFLYMGTPPKGLEHHSFKFICQFYNKKPRYVSLYSTDYHIPIYSAYTFKRSTGENCVDVPWMYEPQVRKHWINKPLVCFNYAHYVCVMLFF